MTDRELLQQALDTLNHAVERPAVDAYWLGEARNIRDAIHAQIEQPETNYKDLYEKEKRRSEMWASKYVSACGEQRVIELAQPEEQSSDIEQEPLIDVLIEAKSNILWLQRRLPKAYEEPPHIARCVESLDKAIEAAHGIGEKK